MRTTASVFQYHTLFSSLVKLRYRGLVIVLMAICAGCTTSAQRPDSTLAGTIDSVFTASDRELPAWLQAAIKRESSGLRYTRGVKLGDHYEITVAGKLLEQPVFERDGNYWYLQSDIGSDQLLECIVYVDERFAFDTLNTTLGNMIEGFEIVEETAISGSQISVDRGVPIAFVEYISRVKVEGELQIYMPKGMVAIKDDRTLICVLGEAGYRATFDRGFRKMVESWKILDAGETADYREVQLIEIQNTPVGYVQIQAFKRDDGGVNVFSDNSMLFANGPSRYQVAETFLAEYASADGALESAHSSAVSNGLEQRSVRLENTGSGTLSVTGTIQGKEVSFAIETAQNPQSSWGVLQTYRQLIGNTGEQRARIPVWSPDVDPSAIVDSEVTVNSRSSNANRIEYALGPIESRGVFDDRGSSLSGSIEFGRLKVASRRVFVEGRLD
jgi:hypothetical protein